MTTDVICQATGKKIFRSPSAANSRRKHIRRKFDERQHTYRCKHCRCWHLGHGMRTKREVED